LDTCDKLRTAGQSLWLNNLSRELIHDGSLAGYIEDRLITGMSFSPEAFRRTLSCSQVYDSVVLKKIKKGWYGEKLARSLILEDVRYAADLLRHIHDQTGGVDGWAILPFSPLSVCDRDILADAITYLYAQVRRPNTLVTVFGLPENNEIIEEIVFAGVPINIAFIYSHDQYLQAAGACLRGIERRIAAGLKPAVSAFISISICRLKAVLSRQMSREVANRSAIAMARKIYKAMRDLHSSKQWELVYNKGYRPLKLVWSSSAYEQDIDSDISLYNELIAPFTIASWSGQAIEKFINGSPPDTTMPIDGGDCEKTLESEHKAGLDLEAIADNLQNDDVSSQIETWIEMLELLAQKSAAVVQTENAKATGDQG
jgi:transaldolase